MDQSQNENNPFKRTYNTLADYKQIEELPDTNPLAIINSNSEIIYCNNSFKQSFNKNEGEPFSDANSDADLVHIVKGFIKSHYSSFHFDLQLGYNFKNDFQNYSVDVERIYIANAEYFVLRFTSVEERLKLEDRLNTIHNAIEYGNVPVIITNEFGEIIYLTKSIEKILNKTIEEVYKQFFTDALAGLMREEDIEKAREAFSTKSEWTKVIVHFDEKGSLSYKEFKLNPILRTTDKSHNYIITANDITHYLLKNQIVKESEKKLRLIINNISDLLLIIKADGVTFLFENANNNFCEVFSIHKSNALNGNIDSILDEKFKKEVLTAISDLHTNNALNIEFESLRNEKFYNGKISFMDYNITHERFYIVTLSDVTTQKNYEYQLKKSIYKEKQLNKLKTAFLENMSHEIRTPFNAISGYSEIIEDCLQSNDFETISEFMVSVREVLNRVTNLFGNIVEVSQIESEEVVLEKVILNCNQVLRSVYEKKRFYAQQAGIEFTTSLSDEELLVEVDWIKLEKIVMSLVENSLKYTAHGQIQISSELIEDQVEISVVDTGEGMNPGEVKFLLEPFSQEEVGYTRKYQGAGLGLTIAYKLTKMLGGNFDVLSEKGTGTKIILSFPVAHLNE
ncbi:MAG: PAS domain-containing sensor histidine kinase [Ignavibacteria bacterium]|jgi:signal transduction histidine kinase|nr:PAS domain-containing sensor histidine kinase [Ignavibacteria bacterium]